MKTHAFHLTSLQEKCVANYLTAAASRTPDMMHVVYVHYWCGKCRQCPVWKHIYVPERDRVTHFSGSDVLCATPCRVLLSL
jgi:hypothetical protein